MLITVIKWLMIGLSLPIIAKLPFEIEANHIKFKKDKLYASGNVVIKYKTYEIL